MRKAGGSIENKLLLDSSSVRSRFAENVRWVSQRQLPDNKISNALKDFGELQTWIQCCNVGRHFAKRIQVNIIFHLDMWQISRY